MFGDLDARHAGGDLFETAAVRVPWLQVEGIHLARSAIHPQQDAQSFAARSRCRHFVGLSGEPVWSRRPDEARPGQSQYVTTRGLVGARTISTAHLKILRG